MSRRLLVTSALPYANGPIHIGHLLEYVQADTWVRFMRMAGHEVVFVCADDSHGTPIMLEAERLGESPADLVRRMRDAHIEDFTGFGIEFDNYHTTHSPENTALSQDIYRKAEAAGFIARRTIVQLYDPVRGQFLADRYIRGTCPHCGAADQTGDNCEACSAVYAATDLIEPRSALSGSRLEKRESEHHFFTLAMQERFLREWIGTAEPGPGPGPRLQPQVEKKLLEWFEPGLQDWDISRDAPYFGIEIPGTQDKYFYVWLDAPIGYFASLRELAARTGLDDAPFLDRAGGTEMYHFIGKDIINFHGLFWPALLDAAGLRTPTRLFVHGFLTVNGAKMSKSKGTFIQASTYRQLKLDPDWFRYYIVSKLNDRVEDVDLSLEDFANRVNADLVNKLANIPSRVARILRGKFNNELAAGAPDWLDLDLDAVAACYEARRLSEVTRLVIAAADQVNRHLEEVKPWEMVKDPARATALHATCTAAVQAFRVLAGALAPVIPGFAARAAAYLASPTPRWADLAVPLPAGHALGEFRHLMGRLAPKDLDRLVELNRDDAPAPAAADDPQIAIDDFTKVDLRAAKVLEAGKVEGADRLVRLRVGLGALGERTIFAGILGDDLESLPGALITVVANLAPRKMRFGVSEGMALGVPGPAGKHRFVRLPEGTEPGARVS